MTIITKRDDELLLPNLCEHEPIQTQHLNNGCLEVKIYG